MSAVNNFDVLKEMSARDKRIMLGLDVLGVRKTKAGTVVEVGIGGDFIGDIAAGRMAVVLLVWDRAEYNAIRDELGTASPDSLKASSDPSGPSALQGSGE